MTRRTTLAVALTAILASGTGLAQPPAQPTQQQPAAPALPPPPPPGTPSSEAGVDLSVEVTISRYQGDDLVSSRPYVLALTTDRDGRGSLHMDAEIPVMNRPVPMPANPANAADPDPARFLPGMSYNYRSVGTQIESSARSVGNGRYKVTVVIEESSVYGEDATAMEAFRVPGVPVFRSFGSSNTLVLRDGQSRQYTAAADRVTGERIRVDVALTVLD